MGNKIAVSLLVAVFVIIALLSTANNDVDSAAASLSTYSNTEIEQYRETVKKGGDAPIMNCILIIACLIAGFLLGRMGSNSYDGLIVLDRRTGRTFIDLNMAGVAVSRYRYITLKVVKEDEEGEL